VAVTGVVKAMPTPTAMHNSFIPLSKKEGWGNNRGKYLSPNTPLFTGGTKSGDVSVSIGIDVDAIAQVLLADGWHLVDGKSFSVDAAYYEWGSRDNFELGKVGLGFIFTEVVDGELLDVAGPISSILAVRQV
jgi:hypothetical protein